LRVYLDTNLLWWLVHPAGGSDAIALRQLVQKRRATGDQIVVAEICDYEARRELIRKSASKQLDRLDRFISACLYQPIDTVAMRRAAHLWADLRRAGRLAASDAALDGDVILSAQALQFSNHVVATKNLRHLTDVCNAIDWRAL